jgi:hypothetical protein
MMVLYGYSFTVFGEKLQFDEGKNVRTVCFLRKGKRGNHQACILSKATGENGRSKI